MRTVSPLLLAALALSAQPPDGAGRGPRPEGGFMRFHPVLSTLDADHDGSISAAELSRAPQALGSLDKNKDGKLAMEETRPAFGGPGGMRGGPGRGPGGGAAVGDGSAMADQLMKMDANGDGALTKEEVPERMQGLFARADADKDGRLTRAELTQRANNAPAAQGRAGQAEGDHHDHEGEGRGPRGGFRDPIMTALDTNQDGAVDAQEIGNSSKTLAKLDRNGNGVIEEQEVRPQMPMGGRRGPRGGEGQRQ